jgi:D-alanyl-D-alanine carboxypeptidase (penicillin-binding protein 5/6)
VQDGHHLIAVLSGYECPRERAVDTTRLLHWAFRSFEHCKLFPAGDEVADAPVYAGADLDVPLVMARDVAVVVEKGGDDPEVDVHY